MDVGASCKGKVYIVGAGPGDPDLLTIKAKRLLEQALIVLHDDLVTPEVLAISGPQARMINVGKRCGAKAITQAEINTRMIEGARQGLEVVRLKGGDPSIFGRLAEELDALEAAGVPYEVIPGVTAGTAAAAMLRVSLTDRRKSSRLIIVSGHEAPSDGKRAKTDWRAVASLEATLVIYMPGHNLDHLRSELLSAGLPAETPAILVSRATRPEQRRQCTTLGLIAQLPALQAPAILLIGRSLDRAGERADKDEASFVLHRAEALLSAL